MRSMFRPAPGVPGRPAGARQADSAPERAKGSWANARSLACPLVLPARPKSRLSSDKLAGGWRGVNQWRPGWGIRMILGRRMRAERPARGWGYKPERAPTRAGAYRLERPRSPAGAYKPGRPITRIGRILRIRLALAQGSQCRARDFPCLGRNSRSGRPQGGGSRLSRRGLCLHRQLQFPPRSQPASCMGRRAVRGRKARASSGFSV